MLWLKISIHEQKEISLYSGISSIGGRFLLSTRVLPFIERTQLYPLSFVEYLTKYLIGNIYVWLGMFLSLCLGLTLHSILNEISAYSIIVALFSFVIWFRNNRVPGMIQQVQIKESYHPYTVMVWKTGSNYVSVIFKKNENQTLLSFFQR